jgi:hypothetical protein
MNTSDRVLRYLQQDEPEYEKAAAALGPRAFRWLKELARSADPLLASKATHLATLIRAPGARAVVEAAAERDEAEVRVAAAAAMCNLWSAAPAEADPAEAWVLDDSAAVLDRLLGDADPGVRKYALRAAMRMGLDDRVEDAVRSESTEPFLREMVEKERRRRP